MKRKLFITLIPVILNFSVDLFGAQPLNVVSRLTHGSAPFDIPLPLSGTPGLECRNGSPPNSYNLVFTFAAPVTFSGAQLTTALGGTLAGTSGSGTTTVIVNLSGVQTAQTIEVKLTDVSDETSTNDVSVSMGVLVGDTTGDGFVNSGDIDQVKSQLGQSVTNSNFREDLNADGNINSGDVSLAKSKSGMGLPYTRFSFTLDSLYHTSAGVYQDGNLIRTLWRNVMYGATTNVGTWDGNDDNGIAVSAGTYEIRLLYHTVQYVWDGVVGNTSSATSGVSPHRGSPFMQSLAMDGSSACYAIGECEGSVPVAAFNTTSPQSRTAVVAPDSLTGFDNIATDGANVYIADCGSSGNAMQPSPNNAYTTFVIARNAADASPSPFPSGTPVTINNNPTAQYNGVIDLNLYTPPSPTPSPDARVNPNRPTGIAVQKSGNILAVAHGASGGPNLIKLFNKTSGALLSQSISNISNPQGLAMDSNGDLWAITGTSLKRYSQLTLTTTPQLVQTISGLTAPIAIAVHPSNPDIVLVADGGTAQVVRAFNRSATSVTQALWTYGLSGGYLTNGPDVADNKFAFQVGARNDPLFRTALSVQSDGSFWIGDGATNRLLHISSALASIPADTIMFLTHNLNTAVDTNYPRRVIGDDFLEFDVDYTKPLQQSWTLRKNWAAGLSSQYLGSQFSSDGIQVVSTLSNTRVYGTIRDFSNNQVKTVVELPTSGNLRICKDANNNNLILSLIQTAPDFYGNGWLEFPAFCSDGSQRYHIYSSGPIVTWYQQSLSGFDTSGNPQWSGAVTLASAPYTDSDPVAGNAAAGSAAEGGGDTGNESVPITSSNVIVSLVSREKLTIPLRNPDLIFATGPHLGGIPATGGTTQWMWKASPSVTADVPFDGLGSFDLYDNVALASSIAMAVGRNVVYGYPGEFWDASEAGQWMHFYDDGLFVGQFGTSGDYAHAAEGLLSDILPGFSGNSFFSSLVGVGVGNVKDTNGDVYLWANDQSQHSGIHRWHILGANTIREQTGTVAVGGAVTLSPNQPTSFPTVLIAAPSSGQVNLSWKAGTGVSNYDIKQATIRGGPYTKIASTANTSYTVASLTNGTPYYFAVSASGSLLNSNEVEAWPFATVGKAGMLRGGIEQLVPALGNMVSSTVFQVSSLAVSSGMPSLINLNNVLGNYFSPPQPLTRTNIGTLGYVLYDTSGPNGGDNVNLKSGFTVTKGSGWAVQSNVIGVDNRFDVDGSPGTKKAIYPNPSASIAVNVGNDTAVHYLTVFCPPFSSDGRSFTLSLTPTGGGSSVTYTASEVSGQPTYLLVYQFEFTGNVTLTATNSSGTASDDLIQGVFLD